LLEFGGREKGVVLCHLSPRKKGRWNIFINFGGRKEEEADPKEEEGTTNPTSPALRGKEHFLLLCSADD